MSGKDNIYEQQDAGPGSFEFNAAVADVFPDMLRRSIPGYDASLTAITALAQDVQAIARQARETGMT